MCLGIPMKVVEIDDFMARCEAKEIMRDVSLFMLQHEDIEPGDYVVVHVGYAIQKMTEHEARSAWEIYDEMLELEAEQHKIGITTDA
ncbi:MAG TPA: HypC/HybG/HupF family hydrogenase formation chaperone [Gammaproteobacteria bacterium]|nr:HypC/HybG/HupF family hydrogenase formation chaperone [Gammaproteobacteria bacterium]